MPCLCASAADMGKSSSADGGRLSICHQPQPAQPTVKEDEICSHRPSIAILEALFEMLPFETKHKATQTLGPIPHLTSMGSALKNLPLQVTNCEATLLPCTKLV